jgi:hypothetical protein
MWKKRLFLSIGHFEGKKNQNRKKYKIMISTLNIGLTFESMGHKIGNPIRKNGYTLPCALQN